MFIDNASSNIVEDIKIFSRRIRKLAIHSERDSERRCYEKEESQRKIKSLSIMVQRCLALMKDLFRNFN